MLTKIILAVPYSDKEKVKALGAKWEQNLKYWYFFEDGQNSEFDPWRIDKIKPNQIRIKLAEKMFLVSSYQSCDKCSAVVPVFSLASQCVYHNEEERWKKQFVLLADVTFIPPLILDKLQQQCCSFFYDYSSYHKQAYLLNHCSCGAKISNYKLYKTRGGAFHPRDKSHADRINVDILIEFTELEIGCEVIKKNLVNQSLKARGLIR